MIDCRKLSPFINLSALWIQAHHPFLHSSLIPKLPRLGLSHYHSLSPTVTNNEREANKTENKRERMEIKE